MVPLDETTTETSASLDSASPTGSTREKALARLEAPATKMRPFRAPEALMRFRQTLKLCKVRQLLLPCAIGRSPRPSKTTYT